MCFCLAKKKKDLKKRKICLGKWQANVADNQWEKVAAKSLLTGHPKYLTGDMKKNFFSKIYSIYPIEHLRNIKLAL